MEEPLGQQLSPMALPPELPVQPVLPQHAEQHGQPLPAQPAQQPLAFLRLNNNDDGMNGKKLWYCQDPMVLQQFLPCRELHHIHNKVFKMKKIPSTPLTWTFTTKPSCRVDGRLQMATTT